MTTKDRSALPGGAALNLERRLSYRFSILATKVIRCVAEMYGPKYGLLPSGWKAMAAIGRFGPVSGKEVCAHTTVEPDKVTRAVDRLVQLGYVKRKQDAADRRRVALSLTLLGRKVYADIEGLTRRVELELQEAVSKQERDTMSRVLGKLEARAIECHIGDRNAWCRIAPARTARHR
jgi:DNA-binding MarR family transcriptional regulator